MNDWAKARAQVMLDPSVTMLNCGSFGPTALPVFEQMTALRRELAMGPTDFFLRKAPPLLWRSRVVAAKFLGTTPQQFHFATNVSVAINIVASSLVLNSPGEILLTDQEYGAMTWTWERMAQRHGLTLRVVPIPTMPHDPDELLHAITTAMTPRTRLVFFSHVTSPTGLVLPAKAICAEARRRGILSVVDGAHAPAMIPLDINAIQADFYAGNLHKWTLAPVSVGFVVAGPGMEDRLHPLSVSWGQHQRRYARQHHYPITGRDEPDPFGSTARTRYVEFDGTRDICPWLSVPEAIAFQENLGFDAIRQRMAELAKYCREVIGKRHGFADATPTVKELSGAMTAFSIPGRIDVSQLCKMMWQERIEIPIGERDGQVRLRVSHHFFTQESEIDRLSEVLTQLLPQVRQLP